MFALNMYILENLTIKKVFNIVQRLRSTLIIASLRDILGLNSYTLKVLIKGLYRGMDARALNAETDLCRIGCQ